MRRQCAAQLFNNLESGFPARQVIIRNDEVGRGILLGQRFERLALLVCGYDPAAPTAKDSTHPFQNQRVIIDHQHKLAAV